MHLKLWLLKHFQKMQLIKKCYTRNPEDWKRVFINAGISTNRTDWMVNTIMFGGGEYIESGKYVTPLYGVNVEGITNEW